MNRSQSRGPLWWSLAVSVLGIAGCENGNEVGQTDDPSVEDGGNVGQCGKGEFESTFAAIQTVVFEGYGCTSGKCHGDAAAGDLDLRAGVAYQNLAEAKSQSSTLLRVMPGEPDESFLYNKLRAATEPDSVAIEGSPMPSGAAPLRPEHLEAVRRWIEAGAPRTGSVGDSVTGRSDGVAELLGACLPDATPLAIPPLDPPAAADGVQLVVAPVLLKAGTEIDVCFAQYYDLTEIVPAEFQDPKEGVFLVNGQRTRQDPHSHHLVVTHSGLGAESVGEFEGWACHGGDREASPCDPLERDACGAGVCATPAEDKPACIGFGPAGSGSGFALGQGRITGAQTAQYYRAPREGLYEPMPIKGILYMNSHSFNLTDTDTKLHGWINLFYAKNPQSKLETLSLVQNINIATGLAPFTTGSFCAPWIVPQGADVYTLSSHTHKRGRNFTVDSPDGTRIYTSAIYSDPIVKEFDPPLRFDSADPAARTLTYCADYNNGVKDDGTPDIDLVTKASTMPDRTTCEPVACVAGQVGAPCRGASDNAACDSTPGAGDGLCDACPITAGQTTENEMFVLSPSIVRR